MLAALVVVLFLFGGLAVPVNAGGFYVKNLVTNDQSAHHAQITDANLVNAWGVSHSGGSPFWVSDNGTGVSTLYSVNAASDNVTKLGLTVSIPGDGSVTGQVFSNITGAFNKDAFLFVSEDGTVSGWRGALGTSAETLVTGSPSNVYKGVSEATISGHSYLYAANFLAGSIDVIKGDAAAPSLAGNFTDPSLPAGYAPFDIRNLGGKLYVTYALQNGKDDLAGAGHGFVSVFDLQGNFLSRVATQGTLNSPWGLEIAPSSFGSLAGDLLVGNFGDGRINAYDLSNNSFVGQLNDRAGNPLTIEGLWGLVTGNDGAAGSSQKLYFTAGPDDESNGLFGVIVAAPAPSTLVISLLQLGVFSAVWYHRRIKATKTGMRNGGRKGPGIPR
jgi:uncharacterized protein (TIGR03118 family)